MTHVNSGPGEDLASADEVKVYDDEGDEERKSSEENLSEDKIGLVTETEDVKSSDLAEERQGSEKLFGIKNELAELYPGIPYPPFLYPYPGLTVGGLGRLPSHHPGLNLYMYGKDHISLPPPAHMGIPPLVTDSKSGLSRPPLYGLPPPPGHPGFFPFYTPEFAHWSGLARYPLSPAAAFPGPYPVLTGSPLSPFSPSRGFLSSPKPTRITSPERMGPGSVDQSPSRNQLRIQNMLDNEASHRQRMLFTPQHNGLLTTYPPMYSGNIPSPPRVIQKRPAVKKPLNAFMLFMKEMRQTVIEECTLKESAAINQILGRRWHALDRTEQAKYYEMAKKEKELHSQKYPGWSARDNYATHSKKKRKRENNLSGNDSFDSDSGPKHSRLRSDAAKSIHWTNQNSLERDNSNDDSVFLPFSNYPRASNQSVSNL